MNELSKWVAEKDWADNAQRKQSAASERMERMKSGNSPEMTNKTNNSLLFLK
jgi:hypothetical protein